MPAYAYFIRYTAKSDSYRFYKSDTCELVADVTSAASARGVCRLLGIEIDSSEFVLAMLGSVGGWFR